MFGDDSYGALPFGEPSPPAGGGAGAPPDADFLLLGLIRTLLLTALSWASA